MREVGWVAEEVWGSQPRHLLPGWEQCVSGRGQVVAWLGSCRTSAWMAAYAAATSDQS